MKHFAGAVENVMKRKWYCQKVLWLFTLVPPLLCLPYSVFRKSCSANADSKQHGIELKLPLRGATTPLLVNKSNLTRQNAFQLSFWTACRTFWQIVKLHGTFWVICSSYRRTETQRKKGHEKPIYKAISNNGHCNKRSIFVQKIPKILFLIPKNTVRNTWIFTSKLNCFW